MAARKRRPTRQQQIARKIAAAKGAATRRAKREGKSPRHVWNAIKKRETRKAQRAVPRKAQRRNAKPGKPTPRRKSTRTAAARSDASKRGWITRRARELERRRAEANDPEPPPISDRTRERESDFDGIDDGLYFEGGEEDAELYPGSI